MLRIISLIFLGIYGLYLGIRIVLLITMNIFEIAIVFFNPIFIMLAILKLAIENRENLSIKSYLISIFILTIPLFGLYNQSKILERNPDKIILSAYSDAVMGMTDIKFYKENTVKYCEESIISEICCYGKFMKIQDTFNITSKLKLSNITKFVRDDSKLFIIDTSNEIKRYLYIDSRFRR